MRILWKIKTFDALSSTELYELLKLRQEVFIVEQACPYLDADGTDLHALHLWAEIDGHFAAYCRIFPNEIKYAETSIGRVLTHPNYRRLSLGKTLMRIAIGTISARFPGHAIKISAQDYLLHFYESFGFEETGNRYLEDDIPHSEMIRRFI